jgi:hypothetical protein
MVYKTTVPIIVYKTKETCFKELGLKTNYSVQWKASERAVLTCRRPKVPWIMQTNIIARLGGVLL